VAHHSVDEDFMDDIQAQIPLHKTDIARAEAAVRYGYPAVAPILPQLLEWLKDINWPVAHVLAPFLASIGNPLVPHIEHIFHTDDEIWKYWIIRAIIYNSPELATSFHDELERIASSPTNSEKYEEVNVVAREVLEKFIYSS
jgi:hypothetical protein